MKAATVLLVLAMGLAKAQLNFDGNPLTEDTEYTAEESQFSQRTARQEKTATDVTDVPEYPEARGKPSNPATVKPEEAKPTARYLPDANHLAPEPVNQAELALSSFLNSKTPEESRMSLNNYLQNRGGPREIVARGQPGQRAVPVVDQQQLAINPAVNQQVSSPVNQRLTTQLMQQRQALQALPVNQRQQQQPQFPDRLYNGPVNQDLQAPANGMAAPPVQQQQLLQQAPYANALQARNDMFHPAWQNNRVRILRGKRVPFAQSRGGPGFYNGPVPGPFKPKAPVEVIYTKPPGFHRGPPRISNPPVPYEDASAWFPDADQPPPSKDVYLSQLYAQSYDPRYYNYIAKTGKIKPQLYGKLGKYHEEEGGGIWTELYRGFKKHGLKNMMTPTFLLGMTLPVITLMLTALVQKRSLLARSDSRDLSQEETIQEYLEQLQRAVECYERKRRKGDDVDEC